MKNIKEFLKNNYKWLILLFTSIIFIWIAFRIKDDPTLKIDDIVYNFIHNFKSNNLTLFFKFITNMINIYVISFICIVFIIICGIKNDFKYAPFVICNLFFILFINIILKQIYSRPRPEFMLIDEYGYSFPSGHSMVAMAFYGLFIYILFHVSVNKYLKYILSFLTFSLIVLIGLSRIYLRVHYFSDVIAGFSISVIYLIIFTKVMKMLMGGLKKEPIYKSFYYAISGLFLGFKKERNIKLHFISMIFVTIFGILLKISALEWIICIILFGLVISFEYMNTAVESAVDLVTNKYHEKARIAKDTAAAAVMFVSIVAFIVGLIIFIPKIFF